MKTLGSAGHTGIGTVRPKPVGARVSACPRCHRRKLRTATRSPLVGPRVSEDRRRASSARIPLVCLTNARSSASHRTSANPNLSKHVCIGLPNHGCLPTCVPASPPQFMHRPPNLPFSLGNHHTAPMHHPSLIHRRHPRLLSRAVTNSTFLNDCGVFQGQQGPPHYALTQYRRGLTPSVSSPGHRAVWACHFETGVIHPAG